jgi:hypothetical protein
MKKLIILILGVSCTGSPDSSTDSNLSHEEWHSLSDSSRINWIHEYLTSPDKDANGLVEYAETQLLKEFGGEGELNFIDTPLSVNYDSISPNGIVVFVGKVKGPNESGGASVRAYKIEYTLTPTHKAVNSAILGIYY